MPRRPGPRLLLEDDDRPHLDRAVLRARDAGGDRKRLVGILRVDQVVAAELLLRLGERAVGDERLTVPHADGRRRPGRLQRIARDHVSALLDRLGESHVGGHDLVLLVLGCALPAVLVAVDQTQVLHDVLLRLLSSIRRTVDAEIDTTCLQISAAVWPRTPRYPRGSRPSFAAARRRGPRARGRSRAARRRRDSAHAWPSPTRAVKAAGGRRSRARPRRRARLPGQPPRPAPRRARPRPRSAAGA